MNLKELEYMEEKVQKGRGMLIRIETLKGRLHNLDLDRADNIVVCDQEGNYLFTIGSGEGVFERVIETIREVTQDEIDSLKRIFAEL